MLCALQVTTDGSPIIPFDSTHKRSYETLLICRRCCGNKVVSCHAACCVPSSSSQSESERVREGMLPSTAHPAAKRVSTKEAKNDLYPAAEVFKSIDTSHCTGTDASVERQSSSSAPTSLAACAVSSVHDSHGSLVPSSLSPCQSPVLDGDVIEADKMTATPSPLLDNTTTNCPVDSSDGYCEVSAGVSLLADSETLVSTIPTSPAVPQYFTLVSIPSKVHSHKPPLSGTHIMTKP